MSSNVISITKQVKEPSKDVHTAIARYKRAMTRIPKAVDHSWYEQLNYNINYYKEHGKLPDNTNMQKIGGKGDAYTRSRNPKRW